MSQPGGPTSSTVRDQTNQVVDALAARAAVAFDQLPPVNKKALWPRYYGIGYFARALKSYRAVDSLLDAGFGEDAFALARTIYETALLAKHLAEAPEERAVEFLHSAQEEDLVGASLVSPEASGEELTHFYRSRGLEGILTVKHRNHLALACPEADQGVVRRLNERLDALSRDANAKRAHALSGVKALARAHGSLRQYETLYRLQSLLVHGHPAVIELYWDRDQGARIEARLMPDQARVVRQWAVAWPLAALDFVDTVAAVTGALGITFSGVVRRSRRNLKAVLGRACAEVVSGPEKGSTG